ncbi:hypothetical protein [Janthinobacterium fluminis]|uniref:Transposase n=1 Tax=Janthinobacterium fluminis TaxID=2987524 RepID=A0ABT5JWJ7_9BURK|nr:hypothetical protein [Janthinobacterium fluminis]MDC8757113.1 hypothetical protein [Janthinobacterium fluminis]
MPSSFFRLAASKWWVATPAVMLMYPTGGFRARKIDGKPGVKIIWHGLDQVMTAIQTSQTLRKEGA